MLTRKLRQQWHRCTVAPFPGFSYTAAMNRPLLSPGAADALLFDLGRVVLDIDFNKTLSCWAGHAGCEPAACDALRARRNLSSPRDRRDQRRPILCRASFSARRRTFRRP